MGNLKHFNLEPYIKEYNILYMVETGTYYGDAVAYGLQFDFKKIFSVELLEEFYNHCEKRFENEKRVRLFNGTSQDGLFEILYGKNIGNTLFWLDAHLPDFYRKDKYDNDYGGNKSLLIPLEEEIEIIVNNKDVSNDVFIIDDLRIYEKGGFKKGNWNGVIAAGVGGIDFIYKLLGETHDIQKLYDDEGYILCTPK